MTVCQCYRHADHGPHEWGETFHCPGNGPFMEAPRPGRFVSEILRDIESSAATAAPVYERGRNCRILGRHSWVRRVDNQFECRFCGSLDSPAVTSIVRCRHNRIFCVYCGHVGTSSPAASAAPTSQEGGENIMHLILNIDGVNHEFTEVNGATAAAAAPATLTIKRPFVVYDVNGDRVDGYKYESRARRNNDARFAGTGYWLGNANTGDFEFVSA